ncbi:hypothetical protein MMC10_008859 [Thelotrema lepadinum]|nr:hypothetical protein [Thelotrema lepadinum]
MSLPLELRQLIYSYLLLDTNVTYFNGTRSFASAGFQPRLLTRFAVSLFTLNRRVSQEALEYFYYQNGFVALQNFFPDFAQFVSRLIPMVILDKRARCSCPYLEQIFVFKASMTCAKDKKDIQRDYSCGVTLVFSTTHLTLTMTLLKYWMSLLESVESVAISLTFNLKSGRYDYSQVNRITTSVMSGVTCLTNFPALPYRGGQSKYEIYGDIGVDQASELFWIMHVPMTVTTFIADIRLLLQQAKMKQDCGETGAAELILSHTSKFFDNISLAHWPSLKHHKYFRKESELLRVEMQTQYGIRLCRKCDFRGGSLVLESAVDTYKSLQHSTLRGEQLTYLYVLCTLAFMGGTLTYPRLYQAREKFDCAQRCSPNAQFIQQKIEKAHRQLGTTSTINARVQKWLRQSLVEVKVNPMESVFELLDVGFGR